MNVDGWRLAPAASIVVALSVAGCSGGGGGPAAASAPPALALSTASLSFQGGAGAAAPPAQTITIGNSGGGTLARPTFAISYPAQGGWLSASLSGFAAPFTLTVQPQPGALGAGTYSATIGISSAGASNDPQTVAVSLTLAESTTPVIRLSATALAFSGVSHRADPASQTVTISNSGAGTLAPPSASVEYQQGSGWLSGEITGSAAPYTLTLRPAIGGLGSGTYVATVRVESPGAAAPQSLSVNLTLSPSWTVLVYANADNDRSTALVRDLAAMGEASLGNGVTVLVAADWSAGRTGPGGEAFPSGTEWYRLTGSGPPVVVATLAEQDFDDPIVLAAAVSDALLAYPSDRYAVVLWGAGASWYGGFGGDEQDTPDDPTDDGTPLRADAIGGALAAALASLGRTAPLDLVGLDASLMMGQEVAFSLRGVARAMAATADVEGGWDYRATLGRLGANPSLTGLALAAGEVQDWALRHASAADAATRAHAALDLPWIQAYADAWADLSAAIFASTSLDWLELARLQFAAQPGYGLGDPAVPAPQPALRDAGQFLAGVGALVSDPAVAAAAAAARDALGPLVSASAVGTGRAPAQAGLSLEATLGGRWPARADGYANLSWDGATAWGDVLWAIAGNADSDPPTIDCTLINSSSPDAGHPPTVRFTTADADAAAARADLAWVGADGHAVSFGAIGERAVAPATPYELSWDGNVPVLSDRLTTAEVYVQPWVRGGAKAVSLVPGLVRDGTAEVEAFAMVVEGTAVVDTVLVRARGALTALPLRDLAGLVFVPLRHDATAGTWLPGAPLAISEDPEASLVFGRRSGSAGTYRLLTTVTDVWGNSATVSGDVTVTAPFGT